jgi:RHS repeat-associated protein
VTSVDGARENPTTGHAWFGSLIAGGADGSGMLYQRNRYYDPQTGRFTQEDPIGLAGGANAYGFGGGDRVNFGDPFGLCCFQAVAAVGGSQAFARGLFLLDQQIWHDGPGATYARIAELGMAVSAAPLAFVNPTESGLQGTDKQFGRKFGEHRDANVPGYRTHQEYRELAEDIFSDPMSIRTKFPTDAPMYPGETHIRRGNDLLRLDPFGNFRSLYRDHPR